MPSQDDPTSPSFHLPLPVEVYGVVHDPADLPHVSEDEGDHQDIYRGRPPTPPPPTSPSLAPSNSSSSSSSSAFGGRLGAISAGVEQAISRWARAWISSSSLSSSSSSSTPSVVTQSKSQTMRRRRRRPRSIATIQNARSELEVAARIRAREDLRRIPRGFVLYAPKLPPTSAKSQAAAERKAVRAALASEDPILRTTSLEEVIGRLTVVLRERARARRVRPEPTGSTPASLPVSPLPSRPLSPQYQDYMLSDESAVARSSSTLSMLSPPPRKEKEKKGKQKLPTVHIPQDVSPALTPRRAMSVAPRASKAWWLDVSSPTWQDMCEIGKFLRLHPLTLEDILTQDPREKLELFPKLGYYFISFRAIESQKTRERVRNILSEEGVHEDEGIVGEVNMYLIIFREGICSFHFADIDEHIDRVRHRIMLLGENANASSDWIAHGLLDSIVDSFFPYLEIIENEVDEIERRVFSVGDSTGWFKKSSADGPLSRESSDLSRITLNEKSNSADLNEKNSLIDLGKASMKSFASSPRFSFPASFPLLIHRARRHIFKAIASIPRFKPVSLDATGSSHPTTTVHRMARIRRLITSLTRFLAVKSEVVAQVKKRLLTRGEWSLGTGTEEDLDIFMYMGDVQDHILTLQQSLAHYERMVSESHPTFLSQLRISVNHAKSGSDKAIMTLTIVSLGVLCCQTLIGLFSMNCRVPHNDLHGKKYDHFATVICIGIIVLGIFLCLVRYWWIQSRQRRLRLKV